MLIVAARPRPNRFLAQTRIEGIPMPVGELIEERLGLGSSGEDAADRGQREGAETDGAFESGENVRALIMSHESQQLLCLQFALGLFGQETVEELLRDRTQFVEALFEEQGALVRVALRMMAFVRLPRSGDGG